MAQFPCLPLWTDAWVADTKHLSIAARGVYMDLLVLMWRTPHCRVPDDNGWLMAHLGITKDEVREFLRPVISEFCRCDGNWIIQTRLQKEFVRAFERQKRMSDLRKRWKPNNKDINTERQH
jgi:uncharacterized protein YdaU (DUF1376 family)